MYKFILRRVIQSIPTIIGVTIIGYLIMYLAPGNPATQLSQEPNLTPQQRQAIADSMGANASFPEQYVRWLIGDAPITIGESTIWAGREMPVFDRRGNRTEETRVGTARGILRGDFGNSLVSQRPVTDLLAEKLPATIELGIIALMVGLIIGIPVGVLAAVWQGGIFDQITRVTAVVVSSVPVFWLGLLLILIFNVALNNFLPPGYRVPIIGEATLAERIRHLILPVFTLSSFSIATYSRFMRASLLDVLNQDYIRTARAKGLGNRRVWFIHATRNALIPIATLLGPSLTGVVAGAVLTETIFAWPGMGRQIVESVRQQDYPIIMAVVMIFSVATVVGYLLSDIFYALLDPRIRLN
jgi:peptide/nickel transport system permease protein